MTAPIFVAQSQNSEQKIRDYHHEMVFLSRQVDKLKEAILQIASETGVKLSVEL